MPIIEYTIPACDTPRVRAAEYVRMSTKHLICRSFCEPLVAVFFVCDLNSEVLTMEKLTQHAMARMQQRGINAQIVDFLLQCGTEVHDHHGATIVYFDKQARHRLQKQCGSDQYRRIERQLNSYAVVSDDGAVMTVGHRVRRIRRH